jgi:Family of unknown function (DUF6328)
MTVREAQPDVARDDGDSDDEQSRLDRELEEMLQELRVALPGVQVLFAFLLTVPFSQGFATLDQTLERVYFAAVLFSAATVAFLITPTAYHRIQFRRYDKEKMVRISTQLTLVGLACLAVALVCAIYVVTELVMGGSWTGVVTIAAALLFAALWFGLPLYRRWKTRDR